MIEVYPVEKPKRDRSIKQLFTLKRQKKAKKAFNDLFLKELDKLRRESK